MNQKLQNRRRDQKRKVHDLPPKKHDTALWDHTVPSGFDVIVDHIFIDWERHFRKQEKDEIS